MVVKHIEELDLSYGHCHLGLSRGGSKDNIGVCHDNGASHFLQFGYVISGEIYRRLRFIIWPLSPWIWSGS